MLSHGDTRLARICMLSWHAVRVYAHGRCVTFERETHREVHRFRPLQEANPAKIRTVRKCWCRSIIVLIISLNALGKCWHATPRTMFCYFLPWRASPS